MRLKSYFAESVEQAISRASRELGPEAMLVYSREAHAEARYLGSYEVVFSVPAAGTPEANAETPLPAPKELVRKSPRTPAVTKPEFPVLSSDAKSLSKVTDKTPDEEVLRLFQNLTSDKASKRAKEEKPRASEETSVEKLSSDLSAMRRQMEKMMVSLARGSAPAAPAVANSNLNAALDPLLQAGISEEIAGRLMEKLGEKPEALTGDSGIQALRRELGQMFTVDSSLGRPDAGPRIVALVGPPGSGKTTTLVKLAVAYGLKSRKPVQLISMDTCRVGGADQLRSYAAILGVGFQALETAGSLAQALEEHRYKDLILIDTPGLSERDLSTADDLAAFLRSRKDVDTHLTLTPSMKSADLRRVVDRYEIFRPSKLLFTKVDETSSHGVILNEAIRTQKPVSYLAGGQRIPEDLEAATKERLLNLVLESHFETADESDWEQGSPAPVERMRKHPAERQAAAA